MGLLKDTMMGNKIDIKNNMTLRLDCEYEIMLAWEDYHKGLCDEGYLIDLDYYYYENWVEPITQMGPHGLYYLN